MKRRMGRRARAVTGVLAVALLLGAGTAIGVAVTSQDHAPQPTPQAAGTTGPDGHQRPAKGADDHSAAGNDRSTAGTTSPNPSSGRTSHASTGGSKVVGPTLPTSDPVAIDIPAIGVASNLQDLGLAPTGAIEVPQPGPQYNEAAWFDGSPTPGELGPSIIEGHIDSAATGPSVFFQLGAVVPGDTVAVTLSDGTVAVFTVDGVRQYPKASFPTNVVYGNTDFAALRLITCGGAFDYTTGHYLANTVVFASLTSSHRAAAPAPTPAPSASASAASSSNR
ncbi:MAG: class F sortase [Acidimicrobiales bacterium]